MSAGRWISLMHAFDAASELDTYERLVAAYAQPHRHYHTAAHLAACLAELDAAHDLAAFPAEVEAALWFHDAVYSPTASDNEERSAAWAVSFLSSAGVPPPSCGRVRRHVLATRHDAPPGIGDSALVVDIDLSILGQDAQTYARFEANVRKEYRWVPWSLYRRKRGEILRSFLERDSIYATDRFRSRYEAPPRRNIQDALARLDG